MKFEFTNESDSSSIDTLGKLTKVLNMTEKTVIQLAINRLALEILPKHEPDDGPLSPEYLAWLQSKVDQEMNEKPEFNQHLINNSS